MQKSEFLKALSGMWKDFDARVLRYKVCMSLLLFLIWPCYESSFKIKVVSMMLCFQFLNCWLVLSYFFMYKMASFIFKLIKIWNILSIVRHEFTSVIIYSQVLPPLCAELRNVVMQPMILPMVLTIAESQVSGEIWFLVLLLSSNWDFYAVYL